MWGWGNEPSTEVKAAAAAADVATAPVQIPAFAVAALNHKPHDKQAALEREAARKKEQEERLAEARLILDRLEQTPALLNEDTFWEQQTRTSAATLALLWFLQTPHAPASPEINAYLLRRFPNESGSILANGRASHSELTEIAGNSTLSHQIREDALDALLRDRAFDFTDPWRKLVLSEFGAKAQLMFSTSRFTRQELMTLAQGADTPKWIQQMAAQSLDLGCFKAEPTAGNFEPAPSP